MAIWAGIALYRDFVLAEAAPFTLEQPREVESVGGAEPLHGPPHAPATDPALCRCVHLVAGVDEGDDEPAAPVVLRQVVGGLRETPEHDRLRVVGDGDGVFDVIGRERDEGWTPRRSARERPVAVDAEHAEAFPR